MRKLKQALLLLLVIVIGMPTAAMADMLYESMDAAFENKILKITLENGYDLTKNGCVYDTEEFICYLDNDEGSLYINPDEIPVYAVKVPAGTEYVYMYTLQDPDNGGGHYAHSQYGSYSASEVYLDGDQGYMAGSGWSAWSTFEKTEPQIIYADLNGIVGRWPVAKVKVPVAQPNEDYEGLMPVTLFCQEMSDPTAPVCPFALYFVENEMDVSSVPCEYVDLTMDETVTYNIDPADNKPRNPTFSVHPIGANSIDNVTWESSDPSIISVEDITEIDEIDEETDSRAISTAKLVIHKTGVVTITVKGGDFEQVSTVTVNAKNCAHADTAETYAPVEGEAKHTAAAACTFCGEQVGEATAADCADTDGDGMCDVCGGEVKTGAPEADAPAAAMPDGAPFSAITTDKGGAISVTQLDDLTIDIWGMTYTGKLYNVVIPEGAESADVTMAMAAEEMASYMDGAVAGYSGNVVFDNEEYIDPGMDGGYASFELVSGDADSAVIRIPMDMEGKSLVKPADYDPDSSPAYYAAGPEYSDYNPVCFFTFEYGAASAGDEPEASGVPVTELNFWADGDEPVTEINVNIGEYVDAVACCTPRNTTENVVVFTSGDTEIFIVENEEATADENGHARGTIKGVKAGTATLTATSKTNPEVFATCTVIVACNHVGTETTSSTVYEPVGGEKHNAVTTVVCECGETVKTGNELNADCVDSEPDGICDLCRGDVEVPASAVPTAIFDSSIHGTWGTIKISKLYVSGVEVKSYEWVNGACIVTLAKDTPADAVMTFSYEGLSGGGGSGAVYVNGTKDLTAQLADGKATVEVRTAHKSVNTTLATPKNFSFITEGNEIIHVESISFEAESYRVVANGGSVKLNVIVHPEDATVKDVEWSTNAGSTSLNITQDGLVTGGTMGMGGYYTVTATSRENPEISATCKVFLDWKPEDSITMSEETLTVKTGETGTLSADVSGTQFVTNTTVSWTSSDESIAAVDGGKVTGVKPGTATITATSYYGLTATCEVTVVCSHIGTESKVDYEQIEGTETHTVTTSCACGYVLGSTKADCADDDNDGLCDKCGGAVMPDVYTISLDKTEDTIWFFAADQQIPAGYEAYADDFPKTSGLKAAVTLNGEAAENAEIVWTSSDAAVATVENGVVTATGAGEAVITATVNDVAAQCTVKVETYIAPAYMNVELVGEFDYSENQPEGETARVIDLTDETQARTITVSAPLYRNVGADDVKTLASMQGVTWEIEGDAECVDVVINDDFTLTATFTGKPGVVNFKPVMLNGYTNVMLPIYVSNGFVTEVNIVREDGEAWEYGEKEKINGVERDVISVEEGSEIVAVSSAANVTQTYNGWMVRTLNDSYATVKTASFNGASFDLSELPVGLYEVVLRVPTYEQNYNIDPLGTNPQDQISSQMTCIRIVEKVAAIPGDANGDTSVNASDILAIKLHISGKKTLEGAAFESGDANGDGVINASDILAIKLHISGKKPLY